MRITYLLDREPFGQILQLTLSAYWGDIYGLPVDVYWNRQSLDCQLWQGNSYLNFFCARDVDVSCFENIIREFSHARSWWCRGVQSGYVRAAISPPFRKWLSQVCFSVSQDIPGATQQLIIGGRNRLRIIHPKVGESVVIAKAGFSRLGFEREIYVRESYARALAPKFLGMRASGMAFAEEYCVGTPANRLPIRRAIQARAEACNRLIEFLHRPTLRIVVIAEHLKQLATNIQTLASDVGVAAQALADLASRISGSAQLGLALTHGDFQNGNILVTEQDLRIIDWETATERSQLYDLATLSVDMRLAPDRFEVWRRQVAKWLDQPSQVPALLVPIDGRRSLLGHVAVWWMEEAVFQLEEVRQGFLVDTTSSDFEVAIGIEQAFDFINMIAL